MSDEELLKAIKDSKEELLSQLLEHIHGVGAQLHTQIQELDTRLSERLDRMEARQDRQGTLIQSGSRAMTRFIEWSESADESFSRYDRRLTKIEKRLDRIEGANGDKSS